MKWKGAVWLLLFLLIAGLAHARSLPDFKFVDLDGKTYNKADVTGMPLVVYVGTHL